MGLVDGGDRGLWRVIVPTGTNDTNWVTNPSFERNTTGWTGTSIGVLNRASPRAANGLGFGVWAGVFTATAQNGRIEYSGPQFSGGTLVVASAYVYADSPLVVLRLAYGGTTIDQAHPGDSQWHRLEVATVAVAATTPIIGIRDGRASAWTQLQVDGIQFETGQTEATTYIDGDQDGCIWNGTPHASSSVRDGRDGRGGKFYSFSSLGLYPVTQKGVGLAPADVQTQPYGVGDGSAYSRTKLKERVITLTCKVLYPSGLIGDLHAARRTVLAAFSLAKRNTRGPISLQYAGTTPVKRVDGYYEGGLEMDTTAETFQEQPLRFVCPDGDFYVDTDTTYILTTNQTLTVNMLAFRRADGTWTNMNGGTGSNITGTNDQIWDAVRLPDGRIVVAGLFLNMGGVAAADYLGVYDPSSNTWAAVGGITFNGRVRCLAVGLDGRLYVGGDFTDAAGIAAADYVAVYDPSSNTWAALATGLGFSVDSIAIDPATGYLWAVGSFTGRASYWNGTTWTNVTTGAPSPWGTPVKLIVGPDGRMYVAGGASGSSGLYVWTGSTWTLLAASTPGQSSFTLLNQNGRIYIGGSFTAIGGVATTDIAQWNGSAVSPVGGGMQTNGAVYSLAAGPAGTVYAAGFFWGSVGGIVPPDWLAIWNGSKWSPFPAKLPNTSSPNTDARRLWAFSDGSVLVAWDQQGTTATWGTTMTAPGISTVTNPGGTMAYPIISIPGNGGTLYWITNYTTGQTITFSGLVIQTGETAVLDLRPGRKTFKSDYRDLRSYILGGSNVASFALAPGDNVIGVYASGAGTSGMYFRTRYGSAD